MSYRSYGRINFSQITLPEGERAWYYSYEELQATLNAVCKNHRLKKVYVSLISYLESLAHRANYYDFSYLGGPAILIFDNVAIEIFVHGLGMVQYREMNLWDVKIRNTKDYPPRDESVSGNRYFYDLGNTFELSFEDQTVTEVAVDRIDCYPFSLNGFDEEAAELAEQTNSLPNHIHFRLDNGVDFGIYAEDMEYFYIELKLLQNFAEE